MEEAQETDAERLSPSHFQNKHITVSRSFSWTPIFNGFSIIVSLISLFLSVLLYVTSCSCTNLSPVALSGKYSDLTGLPSLSVVASTGSYRDLVDKPNFAPNNLTQLSSVAFSGSYKDLLEKPALAPVATSGSYTDLANRPMISRVGVSGDYNDLQGKPTLSQVATTGDYRDLISKPTLSAVASSGSYNDLQGKPTLSQVATTGDYRDLISKPTLSAVASSGNYNDLQGKPTLSQVAATGEYRDLISKPILSAVANSGSYYDLLFTPNFSTVAFTGKYNDLQGKLILSQVATTGDYRDLTSKPILSAVASSGSYNDLLFAPNLSTVAPTGQSPSLIAHYVHWGRSDCPRNATVVYSGVAGGSYYGHSGSGAERLCLPLNPEYRQDVGAYLSGNQDGGLIYGARFITSGYGIPSLVPFNGRTISCALCEQNARAMIVLHVKRTCPSGWTKEYEGWTMSNHFTQSKGGYICVSLAPEMGIPVNAGMEIFPVETQIETGGLPSPPFLPDAEASCVVCSKTA